MNRLRRYFSDALTTTSVARTFGLEVETLFVDMDTRRPIDQRVSQGLMRRLVTDNSWQLIRFHIGLYSEISRDGFVLKYDVGCNLLELTTPPWPVLEKVALFDRLQRCLEEMYSAGRALNAVHLEQHCDGDYADTLIFVSECERLYLELNGPSIIYLGHIAAVHYNVDLVSVEEGLHWMRELKTLFKERGWPPIESRHYWDRFLSESRAGYEPERYGPPPTRFEEYLRVLSQMKVYMNKTTGDYFLENPPQRFSEYDHVEMDMFLAFVWWWSRLRVRQGRLVLEIRAVPRSSDANLRVDFDTIQARLGF